MARPSHRLSPFFFPESVAIIGASADPERIGGRPLRFLIEAGFRGRVYPVNRSGAALTDTLAARSRFALRHADRLAGVDINPFVVLPRGGVCLDALISTR